MKIGREKKVIFYVFRHGKKYRGRVTAEGMRQVRQSAKNNLAGIQFSAAFCSLEFRTLQTVAWAFSALKGFNRGIGIQTRLGFGFAGLPDTDRWDELNAEVDRLAIESNQIITAAIWEKASPNYVALARARLTAEMFSIAKQQAEDIDADVINVLVGSHSPYSELACLDPDTMPALEFADIVRYEIGVFNSCGGIQLFIASSTYIPRGF